MHKRSEISKDGVINRELYPIWLAYVFSGKSEPVHSHRGKAKSKNATKYAEQYALDKQLSNHPPTRRAEGRANGHLPLPSQRPAQHHIGHIGAGNQKYKAHCGKHQQEDEPNISAVIVLMKSFGDDGRSLSVAGYCVASRCAIPFNPALACAMLVPGLSIAKTCKRRGYRAFPARESARAASKSRCRPET